MWSDLINTALIHVICSTANTFPHLFVLAFHFIKVTSTFINFVSLLIQFKVLELIITCLCLFLSSHSLHYFSSCPAPRWFPFIPHNLLFLLSLSLSTVSSYRGGMHCAVTAKPCRCTRRGGGLWQKTISTSQLVVSLSHFDNLKTL